MHWIIVRGSFCPSTDAVSRSVVELASAFQEHGDSVTIVSWTRPPMDSTLVDQLGKHSLRSMCSPMRSDTYGALDRFCFMIKVGLYLLREGRQGQIVLSLEDPTGLAFAVMLAKLLRVQLVHFVYLMDLQSIQLVNLDHGSWLSRLLNRVRVKVDAMSWRLADGIIVLGQCMAEIVHDLQPSVPIQVIPIWQDSRRVHPVDGHAMRRRLGIKNELLVVYFGHATFRQPLEAIRLVAKQLAESPVRFVIAGSGASVDALANAVEVEGLSNVQVMRGVGHPEMLQFLSAADVQIVVLDERATGTCVPSKTYTAMATARACAFIGSPYSQAAIDVLHSKGGRVFRPTEIESLAEWLRSLTKSPSDLQGFGKSGHAYFQAERDLPKAAERFRTLVSTSKREIDSPIGP